jgi:hypothetical protein
MYMDGNGTDVDNDSLERDANDLAKLGGELRDEASKNQFEPPMLGTAPPALWLSGRLEELLGQRGVSGAVLGWAAGLENVSQAARESAQAYRNTDGHNAVTLRLTTPEG